jgi:hypothetical protein
MLFFYLPHIPGFIPVVNNMSHTPGGDCTLISDILQAAMHRDISSRGKVARGVYYYQVIAGAFRDVKKMILLK